MRAVIVAAVLVMAGVGIGAQAPKVEPVYDVTFVAGPPGQEASYTGTSTFNVDAKGMVTGKMAITTPTTVRATIAGQIEKGTWTFKYAYEMPDQGCTGSLEGSAPVPTDRKTISGKVLIGGDCSPEPMNGTFTFKLQEKK
ncbi:MAG TPA: hypothetical protein VMZ90_01895 [Vicinamibacterales bacterium]|nr:hypothetical protein [Vicinamibacterales bacterium]